MSDTCESCGCPEGVDGHDVLYRRIDELEQKKVGIPRLLEQMASSPGAEERKTLCDRIVALEKVVKEAVDIVEGRPDRSPFVAVEEWKRVLEMRVSDDSRKEGR